MIQYDSVKQKYVYVPQMSPVRETRAVIVETISK